MYEPMNTDPRGYMQMGIIVVGGVIRQVSMVKGKYISCNEAQKFRKFLLTYSYCYYPRMMNNWCITDIKYVLDAY